MSEHTPGPWEWFEPYGDFDDDDRLGADCAGLRAGKEEILYPIWHNDRTGGIGVVGSGNAYLISAAPELLEALESLLMACSINGVPERGAREPAYIDLMDARATIAKAHGEQVTG